VFPLNSTTKQYYMSTEHRPRNTNLILVAETPETFYGGGGVSNLLHTFRIWDSGKGPISPNLCVT